MWRPICCIEVLGRLASGCTQHVDVECRVGFRRRLVVEVEVEMELEKNIKERRRTGRKRNKEK